MEFGFGRGVAPICPVSARILPEHRCHRSSRLLTSCFPPVVPKYPFYFFFFSFLEAEYAARLCSLKRQMCWRIFHFLPEWKHSCCLSQRPVSRKLRLACPLAAKVFAIWKSRSVPAALITAVSRRSDGKRHLEHLN